MRLVAKPQVTVHVPNLERYRPAVPLLLCLGEPDLAAEHFRQDLGQVRLLAGHDRPVGKCQPNRRKPRPRLGRLDVGGPEIE